MKLNRKNLVSLLALILIALGSYFQNGNPTSSPSTGQTTTAHARDHGAQWSRSEPALNLWHVFEGEINRKGKPVGFHSRPNAKDPANARLVKIKSRPNRAGVYTATIEIRDGNQWRQKFSSFFPDRMDRKAVLAAVLHAYNNSPNPKAQPWRGPSGHQFQIQGYTLPKGDINTAFPVYVRD